MFSRYHRPIYISRNAIILKPKPAFWKWHQSFEPDVPVNESELNIYLVPDFMGEERMELKKEWSFIYANRRKE